MRKLIITCSNIKCKYNCDYNRCCLDIIAISEKGCNSCVPFEDVKKER